MVVYNITIQVEWNIIKDWLTWQKEEHIPEIMSTQLFDDYKMFRLLEQEDLDSATFIVQYFTSSTERLRKYLDEFAPLMRQKAFARWGNQFIAHHTHMSLLEPDS